MASEEIAVSEPMETGNNSSVEYKPSVREGIVLGVQHVLAMFAGNVTVPIIVAGVLGATVDEKVFLIQAAMFVAGIATLVQTIGVGPVGARLPVVQGTSFGFLPIALPIAKAGGLSAVFGGAIVCGVVQMILGFFMNSLRRFFPAVVSGTVVTTIGIMLLPTGIKYAAGGAHMPDDFGALNHWGLALLVIAIALGLHQFVKGFFAAASILIAIIVGYLVAIPMGMVDFGRVAGAAWFELPKPLAYGLDFPVAAVVSMVIMAFVTTMESVGDISGITMGGAKREPTKRELSGGIMGDGFGTFLAGFLNALPNTTYSQNVGLVAYTGVMSRHVVTYGGVFLILAGLFPKLGAVVGVMPNAVLGGAAIVMFGMIVSAGIKLLASCDLNRRNMLIIAMSLSAAIGLAQVPEALSSLDANLAIVLKSGVIPAGFVSLILNLILPKEEKA